MIRPRPSDLAGIAIPPVSISATTTTSTPPPTSPPWSQFSHPVNPFGDPNGRRDSFTTPYRRTSTSASISNRPALGRSMTSASNLPRHTKLHKRSDSLSSTQTAHPPQLFTMPSPIQNEFTNPALPAPHHVRHSSANKIKPYLRKMSLRDDDLDQGRLDLSRPSAENESLTGLGLCETYSRSVSDVSFVPTTRRKSAHARATSGPASLAAAATGPLRPTQPFAPLKEAPNSFTPPATISQLETSDDDDEADESVGVLSNDIRQLEYEPWKPRRSISINSCAAITPLSQTYTTASLTKLPSASQSNLSIRSQPSYDQIKSGRSHRNTTRNSDCTTTPSARTSIDKAFSFITRTSEPEDAASRAAAIRAARRAFDEKEAAKELKYEQEEVKRRASVLKKEEKKEERKRRKSEVPRMSITSNGSNDLIDEEKAVGSTSYACQPRTHSLSLPIQGETSGAPLVPLSPPMPSKTKQARGGWNHFLAWTRTRLLNCGGKGSSA